MLAIALLVVALGSDVRAQANLPPGHHFFHELEPGFFRCGHYQCQNISDVTCKLGRCDCGENALQVPREICAIPDEHCTCALYGDPHMRNFFGDKFTLPLPCTHMLADFTTPPTINVLDGCQVVVLGVAFFPNFSSSPIVSVEHQIDVFIVSDKSRYKARIIKGQPPETDFKRFKRAEPADIVVNESNANGTFIIDIPACEIKIRFRPENGFFDLVTPVGTIDSAGLCGECEEIHAGTHYRHLTEYEWLELLIDSLFALSPFDNTDINIYEECSAINERVADCNPGRKQFAITFCGDMLINATTRNCIEGNGSLLDLGRTFSQCYESVCDGRKPCAEYTAFYGDCDFSNQEDLLNNDGFCGN